MIVIHGKGGIAVTIANGAIARQALRDRRPNISLAESFDDVRHSRIAADSSSKIELVAHGALDLADVERQGVLRAPRGLFAHIVVRALVRPCGPHKLVGCFVDPAPLPSVDVDTQPWSTLANAVAELDRLGETMLLDVPRDLDARKWYRSHRSAAVK